VNAVPALLSPVPVHSRYPSRRDQETHRHPSSPEAVHRGSIVLNSSDYRSARAIIGGKLGRRFVSRLLWASFPECRTEEQVAEAASLVLDMEKRHVRRLLDCEHSVNIDVALALIALAGWEKALAVYAAVASR
jgi:hypothetical protein